MSDSWRSSARALAASISSGELAAEEVMRATLARIQRLNARLGAFLHVDEKRALARARQIDESATGASRGALAGVPFGVKDLLDVAGMPTTNGSPRLPPRMASGSATVIERLEASGAICVGKLNAWAYGMGSDVDAPIGPAKNPWDTDRSPGGSSSGAGAAVAAGLVPFAIATDTGGSTRWPAAFCGVTGLKPTLNTLPTKGVTPLSWTLDHVGVLSRDALDAALVLGVAKEATYAEAPSRAELKGVRLGVPRTWFFEGLHPEVKRVTEEALSAARAAGATFVDVDIPLSPVANSVGRLIAQVEAASHHEPTLLANPAAFDERMRQKLDGARFMLGTDYVKALRVRNVLAEQMSLALESCDAIAVPTHPDLPSYLDKKRPWTRPVNSGNTLIGNLTGVPAVSIVAGLSTPAPKLPIGLMLYGHPDRDEALLSLAAGLEALLGGPTRWPKVAEG